MPPTVLPQILLSLKVYLTTLSGVVDYGSAIGG